MTDDIPKIVAGLPELTSVTGVWKAAGRRLARGDAAWVADLGIALAGAYGSGADPVWQYRSVHDHLLRLLATTPGHVAQALRLAGAPRPTARRAAHAYAASLLAAGRPAEELAVAFTGPAPEELRACLVHELVLRGVAVTRLPGVADWAASPHWRHHPLGRLPLERADVESHPDLPHHGVNGSSNEMPYGLSGRPLAPAPGAAARLPAARESTTPAAARRIGAAVANWAEESNGRVEARVFTLDVPVTPEALPALLPALDLDCLAGTEPGEGAKRRGRGLHLSRCGPDRAWRVLFAAASQGGAYNSGLHGAYGRLAAWRSLAGLAGSDGDGDVAATAARARESAWCDFTAGTDWFQHVAWDIGLAALSADRRRIAVLAATDTD